MFGSKKGRVLPLEDVEIRAWPEQNFLFGILPQQEGGTDWIMNHFIQLRGAHYLSYQWDAADASVTFYPYSIHQLTPNMFDFCPFINKYAVPKMMVKGLYGKFHDFVREALDGGYYISTFLDQFFRSDLGGRYGFRHPAFIYGYDDSRKRIYLADNFERGKYGRKEISYAQLNEAFRLVSDEIWEVSVFLYRVIPFHYEFVYDYVKEQIHDYLHPGAGICYLNKTVCPERFHRDENYLNEVFFGVECYDLLDRCLEAILEDDPEYSSHDWRSIVQLCDHKRLMWKRYEYVCDKGYMNFDQSFYEQMQALEKECLIAQNMYIKYTASGDLETIVRLRKRMRDIREEDIRIMERWIGGDR